MSLKVTAIQKGYYGLQLREPGRPSGKFMIEDESEFSKKWMVKGHQEFDADTLMKMGRDGKRQTQELLTSATKGARVSDKSPI